MRRHTLSVLLVAGLLLISGTATLAGAAPADAERAQTLDGASAATIDAGAGQAQSDAVVRGRPGNAGTLRGPPLTATRDNSTLVVGAVAVGEQGASVGGKGGVTARLRTNVTHVHQTLPEKNYRLAFETATPDPMARGLRSHGFDTTVSDLDGDGVPSVVAGVEGQQEIELVVHTMHLEMNSE